ncbi:CYT2 protein, partial [Amia calva]|nr:CYT2 protein [Amia calva]
MLKIVSAREQVVAGMKYYLEMEMGQTQCKKGASTDVQSCPLSSSDRTYLCHFEVLSVPWTQLTQLLKSSCTAPVHVPVLENAQLDGGIQDVSPLSLAVQKAAQFAVDQYNKDSKDQFAFKMLKIVSAREQVVAGMKYYLEMEMGQTQCKKGASADVQSCPLSSSDQTYLCHFEVLSVPWTQLTQLLKSSCTAPVHVPVLENAQLDGGIQDVSPLSLAVQKVAQFAVDQYNKDSKDQFAFKMLKIVSAREQVVAGMKYYLEMEMGQTQCKKGASTDVQSCPLSSSDQVNYHYWPVFITGLRRQP